jgi:HAD superfamily hydrolase (TIGR01490 family)
MTLAIFDLDHTLIDGDSDYLWGEYMVENGIVDAEAYRARNLEFYEEYQRGSLDNDQYLEFSLEPLTRYPLEKLDAWRRDYVERWIKPLIKPGAAAKFDLHRNQGHALMIISATHRFITEPIAEMLQIPCLLATEPEIAMGRYTGRYLGTPTYREGKVVALGQWLDSNGESLDGAYFYSDSINDLPLLEAVEYPITVGPDDELRAIAEARDWPIIEL